MNIRPEDFPGAENAVRLCESLRQWDMYSGLAQSSGIQTMLECMARNARTAADRMSGTGPSEVILTALKEWDHTNFHRYIAIKLGAM